MRVLTWNLGFWLHRSSHEDAWRYVCDQLQPDLAFLQEVKVPSWVPPENVLFEEITQQRATAIYAPSLPLSKKAFSLYQGRVVAADVTVNRERSLFAASIHAPIINGRVFPHLAKIFAELESTRDGHSAVIGGDLNSARLAETVWPGYGHGSFFERIDSGDVWIDCCRRFHSMEIQTFFGKPGSHPFQDDHLFVSRDLAPHIRSCDVIKNELTRRVSDHIPLVTELDLEIIERE